MTNSRGTYYSKREKEGFYNMAKKQGFRARSYFKLEQIDVKYNIIKEGKSYEAGQYAAERPIHCFRKKLDIYEKPKSL